jgi:ribosomal-protein-alanine N-acetyltransferase
MQAGDLDTVAALEARAYGYPWSRRAFADSLRDGHDAWLLCAGPGAAAEGVAPPAAPAEEIVLGYLVAMRGVDEWHLLNLTVSPDHQRCGWGMWQLRAWEARARLAGVGALWLEVRAGNRPALSLYRAAGFEATGLRKGYYPARAGREDAVLMSRSLLEAPATGEAC